MAQKIHKGIINVVPVGRLGLIPTEQLSPLRRESRRMAC